MGERVDWHGDFYDAKICMLTKVSGSDETYKHIKKVRYAGMKI